MNKSILASLLAIIAIVLTSCSSDPWVGEWCPDNDLSGNSLIIINSNGSAEWICDYDDGSSEMTGKWSVVENQENTIKIDFDPNSISIDCDNPLTAVLLRNVFEEVSNESMIMEISEDGKFLHAPGATTGLVRYN